MAPVQGGLPPNQHRALGQLRVLTASQFRWTLLCKWLAGEDIDVIFYDISTFLNKNLIAELELIDLHQLINRYEALQNLIV